MAAEVPSVLVTGAEGFTGSRLSEALSARGWQVHRGIQKPSKLPGFCHFPMDDRGVMADALQRLNPSHLVHLAGIASPTHSNRAEIYETNVLGALNLAEALPSASGLRHVVAASSAAVYGASMGGCIDEAHCARPTSDYGVSKLAAEGILNQHSDTYRLVITRPFNYTGIGQPAHFVLPKIVNAFRERTRSLELGNIDVAREFNDVRDVVDVYVRLIEASSIAGTFNLSSGNATSLRSVIDWLETFTGHSIDVTVNEHLIRANDPPILSGSPEKLKAALGTEGFPFRPLEDTLTWMCGNDV